MSAEQVAARYAPGFFEGPTWVLSSLATLLIVSLIVLGVGFGSPLRRTVPDVGAYHQIGTFSYSATVTKPTLAYPTGVVTTGQPIYPSLTDAVTVNFQYRFRSALPHRIRGTVSMRALLLSTTNTWQQLSNLKTETAFTGDVATVTSTLPLADLYNVINNLSVQAGVPAGTYSADIQPVVQITGLVGAKTIKDTFQPVLPFDVNPNAMTLNVATAPPPPGATYALPSAAEQAAATTNPSQTGTIPHLVGNVVRVAKYAIPVPALRVLAVLCLLLTILAGVAHDLARRRKTVRSDEEVIARRLRTMIVPVFSLGEPNGRTCVDVQTFSHLAGVARFLERPILYALADGERTFVVDEEAIRYRYRPRRGQVPPGEGPRDRRDAARPMPSPQPGGRHGVRRSPIIRGGGAFLFIGTVITLTTSFTASTNVPITNAGSSTQALLVSQLAPAGCSSLGLTSLVTGSGTFSNSKSNSLVLGSAGNDNITDTGAHDCIAGGGGTNTIVGTSTDICVSGANMSVAVACPTVTCPSPSYASSVTSNSPSMWYRLGDSSGSTAVDSASPAHNGTYHGSESFGVPGPAACDSTTAVTLDGSSGYVSSSNQVNDPETFTLEAWIKTTTQSGGLIVGFGLSQTGMDAIYDRQVYMANSGRIYFNFKNNKTVSSPLSYNDGKWHMVDATLGSSGEALYVDGALVASNSSSGAWKYSGYWRIGFDQVTGASGIPSSNYFAGTVADVAAYPTVLSTTSISNHYTAAT